MLFSIIVSITTIKGINAIITDETVGKVLMIFLHIIVMIMITITIMMSMMKTLIIMKILMPILLARIII